MSKLTEILMQRAEGSDENIEWDAGCVHAGLYVGSLRAARDITNLRKHNITRVLTVAGGLEVNLPGDIHHLVIDIADHPNADLLSVLELAMRFLDESLLCPNQHTGSVFVHCASGVSRSVSVCCAWLMTRKNMQFPEALDLVKINRPRALPNIGFKAQLLELSVAENNIDAARIAYTKKMIAKGSVMSYMSNARQLTIYILEPIVSNFKFRILMNQILGCKSTASLLL